MIKSVDEWVKARSSEMDDILFDVQLTLENEAKFYRWCFLKPSEYKGELNLIAASASHWRNSLRYYYYRAAELTAEQSKYLRHYFKWRYLTDQKEPMPPYRKDVPGPAEFTATIVEKLSTVSTSPQEKPIMSTKLTFKTQFLLNGVDITGQNKNDIYTAIAVEEQRLEELRKIKHQPRSLKAEIEAGEAALQALVEHLDT